MKNVLKSLLILAVLHSTVSFAQLPNAIEIAPKMYPGWNLGNTLEGGGTDNVYTNKGGLGAEKAWQGTTTTQEIIDFVAAQGFKSVRLPAAWVMGHIIDGEEGMTIDPAWMARVKEIVDYCIHANLYVLLNDHWDGGWIQGTMKKDISEPAIEQNSAKMKRLWSQIAEAFRDYDEHLLFAGLNEPEAETEAQTKALMTYEQTFIDAVRATGGNNATRTLVVQGPNTSIELSSKWVDMSKFNDPAKNALMIEVHYYSPPQFTGVWEGPNGDEPFYFWGAANHVPSGSYKRYNCTWGEEAYVREQFDMMKKSFTDKGVPVILGEYGANWREFSNSSIQKKHDASILLFHKTINEEAVKRGIIPYVWDINNPNRYGTGGIMCVIDRSSLSVFDKNALKGIMTGVAAATWGGPSSGIRDVVLDRPFFTPDGPFYNMAGQRVAPGTKGLVITRGRKWVVK
ncbi:MAG: glycoside hydrolase family 5 protein [Prevotella sp.]|nr:glycoside hydrolase family 5 protein [Prevotella sp.]